jgi:hypothetical protein
MVDKHRHTNTSFAAAAAAVVAGVLAFLWGYLIAGLTGLRCDDTQPIDSFSRWFCSPGSPTWIFGIPMVVVPALAACWFTKRAVVERSVGAFLAGVLLASLFPIALVKFLESL